jgi:hypothetical protein
VQGSFALVAQGMLLLSCLPCGVWWIPLVVRAAATAARVHAASGGYQHADQRG